MDKSLKMSVEKSPSSRDEVAPLKEKTRYIKPTVTIMDEEAALSSFQATAAGTAMWWVS